MATGAESPYLSSWLIALPAVLLAGHLFRDPGALGEELGWRGFALPRLLELMDARRASLLLGLVWAVWHLPAFFLSTLSQSQVNFGLFILNRSEEHTSELQSLMRISYAVFCLKKKNHSTYYLI